MEHIVPQAQVRCVVVPLLVPHVRYALARLYRDTLLTLYVVVRLSRDTIAMFSYVLATLLLRQQTNLPALFLIKEIAALSMLSERSVRFAGCCTI